jgi:hypothetical protein
MEDPKKRESISWGMLVGMGVLLVVVAVFVGIIGLAIHDVRAHFANKATMRTYCGPVKEVYRTDPAKGARAESHVVYYVPERNRYVDVLTTPNTCANTAPGQNICFPLTDDDFR